MAKRTKRRKSERSTEETAASNDTVSPKSPRPVSRKITEDIHLEVDISNEQWTVGPRSDGIPIEQELAEEVLSVVREARKQGGRNRGVLIVECHYRGKAKELSRRLKGDLRRHLLMFLVERQRKSPLLSTDRCTLQLKWLTPKTKSGSLERAKRRSHQTPARSESGEPITAESLATDLDEVLAPILENLNRWLASLEHTRIPCEHAEARIGDIRRLVARAGCELLFEGQVVSLNFRAPDDQDNATIELKTLGATPQRTLYTRVAFPPVSARPIR